MGKPIIVKSAAPSQAQINTIDHSLALPILGSPMMDWSFLVAR